MNYLEPFPKMKCLGCGALVKDTEGIPHKYIGASQGCWDLYGQVLTKEYGEYNYPELTHRLTVDTYAIQHPGIPSRQSIQSVNVHLISLYLILVKGIDGKRATERMAKILSEAPAFQWLDPPQPNGLITVLEVLQAESKVEHMNKVREWAVDVWKCWESKHGQTIKLVVKTYID